MSEGQPRARFYRLYGKRLFDLVAGSALLVALAPVVILVGLGSAALGGRPMFFRQLRPGRGERPFTLTKFRSMREPESPSLAGLETDADRLTGWGRFLRSTSLDELPELWSVLRGDMSLVGPRPLLMEYLDLYSPEQRRRHEVRPGLTGWAQIHGRNVLSWPEKFSHDVWYVDHHTFVLDLKILAMTLFQVIRGRGVSAPEHATMPRFEGNEDE